MLSDQFVTELGIAIQAQNHTLNQLKAATTEVDEVISEAESKFSAVGDLSLQLQELDSLMSELEDSLDWLEEQDFGDFDPEAIQNLYENRQSTIFRELTKIGFKDWDSFVRQCRTYALYQGIDPLAPYEAFLTEADLQQLQNESYDSQYTWDEWDYIFVGASGVLASLSDFLLVRIPQTMTSGEYAGQEGSPITAWLKQYDTRKESGQTDWLSRWAQYLSDTCKVPYDSSSYVSVDGVERILGMNPKTHRLQSLGHDPVLGFIFGIFDILQGTITGFSYNRSTQMHSWMQGEVWSNLEPVGLIEAMLRHIGHLISDVATPMGLPAPFMALIQGINVGNFGENNRTIGELARWMYLNGYDLRHFLISGITPAVIEIILRAYIMLRHCSKYGETKFDLAAHPKYRAMLLAAHSIATLGNAGKIVLMQGNPLAINYAEWLACIRYLVPSLKYWIFDQHQLRLEHMEKINSAGWDSLLNDNDRLLELVFKEDFSPITLR